MSAPLRDLRATAYLRTVVDPALLGPAEAEVAFVGRSNVGKSSLLNALCGRKRLAHISQVPGKTRTLNIYAAAHGRWLVDLPGYGYASGDPAERDRWPAMIEGYLTMRDGLRGVYLLIDAKVGATELDRRMAAWLEAQGIPFRVVANKGDKVRSPAVAERCAAIAAAFSQTSERVYWTSARTGTGISDLVRDICAELS